MRHQAIRFTIRHFYFLLCISIHFLFFSCTTLYDHYTFTETIETKVQIENLIRQSVNSFSENKEQVTAFQNQLQKMLIYEKAKDKNEITIKMWEYINSPNSSVSKFLKLWEEKDTLSPAFTEEFKVPIQRIFDLMVAYENKKDQPTEDALQQILQTP
ncbi:hypothetical protein NBT05_08025 [Aquimarina sp. ERC-38]|uniref:hypothetical protein n=1 Tax=Aquimarina sp. ERC-38 TaxID=2949996 RepID=UPI002247F0B1|nr:hypothetical protein [Aquimarina sp. ERC-38]UZO82409.1 hypothetical protein NBT05_08025 [Aquimarina sp. ERC-38]